MNILKQTAAIAMACVLPYSLQAEAQPWGEVDANKLEAIITSNVPHELVDARTDKWFDGTLIRGAKRLPADASDETIAQTLPNKTEMVIVYCGGEKCPASKQLAQRLVDVGYKNVFDYHGGISEWKALGKPTQKKSQ